MSDSTWLLLQLCVAGWAGLLMWGLVLWAGNIWNRVVHVRRVHAKDESHPTRRPRVIGNETRSTGIGVDARG
jgi:hypothetical protein